MQSSTRVLLATVLLASAGVGAHAQAPLTNAQLVAKVTALEQEVARLQGLADICAPTPRTTDIVLPPDPTGHQSLGDAAAAAAKVKHEWAAPANAVPRFDPTTQPLAVNTAPAASDGASPANGEAYWRGRVAPLQQQVEAERARVAPMHARIADLTITLNGIGPLNARRGGVEAERQRLITDAQRLDTLLAGDVHSLDAIEEEGRRAGALPGWFRP